MTVLTIAQCRELDRLAFEKLGLPTIVLMENAARALADEARRMLPPRRSVLVVCGPGNNGGDGYAAARLLAQAGVRVAIVALAPPTTPDARVNHDAARRLGLPIRPWGQSVARRPARAGVIIDAIFGTGLSRPPQGPAADAIAWINRARASILAADVPSGLDADEGVVLGGARGVAVRADATVTFAAAKPGLAREFAGRVVVAGIGVPLSILRARPRRGGTRLH